MASLFDVRLRPPEPTDQEISEALLGTWKISRWVHRSENVVLRNLPIEGSDQAREAFRANHGVKLGFLHCALLASLAGTLDDAAVGGRATILAVCEDLARSGLLVGLLHLPTRWRC
jgi:hypothetical protein